jgi:predicted TIM-barrel fold metal-dependent hydrolase
MLTTDCHVHVQPYDKFMPPEGLERMRRDRPHDFDLIMQFATSPACFLKFMDQIGVERAGLINSLPPGVHYPTNELNDIAAAYAAADRRRLIACGHFHPLETVDAQREVEHIVRLGMRFIKLHPPHQWFYPNDYLHGLKPLETLYRVAEANGIPIMFHTGTSIFAGARNKYGDPMPIDDVAVDFPGLKIIMAHGGRPLWMDAAFFLVRRHANVYMDISSVPPARLLHYFPRLEEIAHKALYGSDWPGPGVPGMGEDLEAFRALPLSAAAQRKLLCEDALAIWPE